MALGLGLHPPVGRSSLARALALAGVLLLLGVAATRPAVRTTEERVSRTDAQAFFVLDVSRSMLAAEAPQAPTRLERAKDVVTRLRVAVRDVPAGVAGLTDRVLPYVFPTSDPSVFEAVLARSVSAESPAPREVRPVATSFDALADLQRRGFFPAAVRRRLCVLVTDGESRPSALDDVAQALLDSPPCRLVVVRVGNPDERIFASDGRPEAQYRPLETASASVEALVSATGGRLFAEDEAEAAGRALTSLAASGPTVRVGIGTETTELAVYFVLGAALLILALVLPDPRSISLPTRNELTTIFVRRHA